MQQIENRRGEFGQQFAVVTRIARVRDLADAGRQILADAGNLAQARFVERAQDRWGWLAAMSAPLRYARILKGLSLLISSRSAISRRIRAIARLSKRRPSRSIR